MSMNCARCGRSLTPAETGAPCPNCGGLDRNVSATDQAVGAERAEKAVVAQTLARKHFEVEAGLTRVFRIVGKTEVLPTDPIKLLEVNENTVPCGVMPLFFGPSPAVGIPYPTVIVEVTPEEFQKIQAHELKLPEGWEIGEELSKPPDHAGGA